MTVIPARIVFAEAGNIKMRILRDETRHLSDHDLRVGSQAVTLNKAFDVTIAAKIAAVGAAVAPEFGSSGLS